MPKFEVELFFSSSGWQAVIDGPKWDLFLG
jgi:hypothetical protein